MKRCPQCGKNCSDEYKFCSFCGSKLLDMQAQSRTGDYENPEHVSQTGMEQGYQQPMQANYNYGNQDQSQYGNLVKPAKKKLGKIGTAAVAAAALVLIGSVAVRSKNTGAGESIVYMSNGHYYSLKGTKQKETQMIPSSDMDDSYSELLQFSPGGKYVYYFGNYDDYDSTGELWRCEYQKLGKDSSKNEKYCEKIDSDVCANFFLPDDNGVVYTTGNGELKYFNGKNTYYFADASSFYSLEGENRIVYEIANSDSGHSLYGVELKKPDEKILLADGYEICYRPSDFDTIFYGAEIDDVGGDYDNDEWAIYVTGFGKESEKIGQGSPDTCFCNGKMAYVLEENGEKAKISDLIKADGVSQDVLELVGQELIGDTTYKTLYEYKDGKRSVVSDRILEGITMGNCILYTEANQMELSGMADMNIDEIWKKIDTEFEEMLCNSCVFLYSPMMKKSVQYTYDTHQSLEDIMNSDTRSNFLVTENGNILYFYKELYGSEIQDGKIQPFSLLSEDGFLAEIDNEAIYYADDRHTEGDSSYYNIYSYQNGESKCILSDVLNGDYNHYKDGGMLFYSDDDHGQGYTATFMNRKGKSFEVGKGDSFVRVGESKFLYRNNGDLWLYDNGESTCIANDVDIFWSQSSMELNNEGLEIK